MEKIINLGGEPLRFKASAATVRNYRDFFGRDLLRDMAQVTKDSQAGEMTGEDLEIFENFAYLCRRDAEPEAVPPSVAEWLQSFDMLDIYNILPELITLWVHNNKTLETAKKKAGRPRGN